MTLPAPQANTNETIAFAPALEHQDAPQQPLPHGPPHRSTHAVPAPDQARRGAPVATAKHAPTPQESFSSEATTGFKGAYGTGGFLDMVSGNLVSDTLAARGLSH